ncbi:MAG: FecR domain-containing protein [Bacteroidota bacterium]
MEDLNKYKDILNHEEGKESLRDEMADFLIQSAQAKIPIGKGKAVIWKQIAASVEEEKANQVRKFSPWILSGAAASIALVVAFVFILQSPPVTETIHLRTISGESLEHRLPDGSVLKMNAISSILYNEDWDRTLKLTGEAFFQVTKGKKFTVQTALGSVDVLGTSFNVFARDSLFEVTCKTGRVRVSIPEKGVEAELTPGNSVLAKSDTVLRTMLSPEEIGTWTAGEFYFSNRPVREVLKEVERQYNTEINLLSDDSLRFTGYFYKKADLASTLNLICLPLGLKFKQENERYIITADSEEL